MKKHYPELDAVSDFLDFIPHPKSKSVAKVIRTCNDKDTHTIKKLKVVLDVFI